MNNKIRVLIVDDSSTIVSVLTRLVDNEPDMEVIATASNGQDAIVLMTELAPDVVTLDMEMPDCSGLDILDHFNNKPPCPVIVISGHHDADVQLSFQVLSKGAAAFIEKRVDQSVNSSTCKQSIINQIRQVYRSK